MATRKLSELAAGAVVLVVAAGFLAYAVANTGHAQAGGNTLHAAFDSIDGLSVGSDVRMAGVKVGAVTQTGIDTKTFQAQVAFSVPPSLHLPTDSSAQIVSDGLLGAKYLSLAPGGASDDVADGGTLSNTQSSVSLEQLLGKFIFSVTDLSTNVQKSLDQNKSGQGGGAAGFAAAGQAAMSAATLPPAWRGADGTPIACREKLKVLAENHAELATAMRDTFEDAVLMGVDEQAMRDLIHAMVADLHSPRHGAP